jgi:hypothetical protein
VSVVGGFISMSFTDNYAYMTKEWQYCLVLKIGESVSVHEQCSLNDRIQP